MGRQHRPHKPPRRASSTAPPAPPAPAAPPAPPVPSAPVHRPARTPCARDGCRKPGLWRPILRLAPLSTDAPRFPAGSRVGIACRFALCERHRAEVMESTEPVEFLATAEVRGRAKETFRAGGLGEIDWEHAGVRMVGIDAEEETA